MINLPTFDSYVEALEYHAAQNAEAPAVHFDGATIDFGELLERVDLMARSLVGAGVEPGDRVACLSTPRPEFWTAFLAVMRIGAVYVGLNPAYSRRELIHVVSDCGASLLLSLGSTLGHERDGDVDHLLQQADSLIRAFRLDAGEASDSLRSNVELLGLAADVDDKSYRSRIEAVAPTDPAAIVYTSGSSGTPKGALLPSFGLAAAARSGATLLNLD
ncbi:MAG: acyl--CoA ligase, partial [Actinomycetia bacterium]|nr:acyl--CoA ligase [Actinomycetes bacterium]